MIQSLLIAVFPALVIVAALRDVTSYRIPNWISAALIVAFFPAALVAGQSMSQIGVQGAVGVAALVAGMIMFAAGWIGGGDAKLFAAVGLWLGPQAMAPFVLVTALAGGALAVFLLNLRADWARALLPTGPNWMERLRTPDGDAPYGLAIATGALIAFPQSALFLIATA